MVFYEDPSLIPADRRLALQQGDVLCPVPFSAGLASNASVVLEEEETRGRVNAVDLTRTSDEVGSIYNVLVSAEVGVGIVVTQTCDLERRDRPITVARVRPFKEVFGNAPGSRGFFDRLKTLANPGRWPNQFLLPGGEAHGFAREYSVASLLELQTFSHLDLDALSGVVKLRLSETALGAFQERIAICFGRRAVPEDLYISDDLRAEWEKHVQR